MNKDPLAVSKNYREVLGVLLSFAVKRRRVFPTLETIARMAMVSKAPVLNAIAWLALYGFLDKCAARTGFSGVTFSSLMRGGSCMKNRKT